MFDFDAFSSFLKSLKRSDENLIFEAIEKGYEALIEALADDYSLLELANQLPPPDVKKSRGHQAYSIKFWGAKGRTWLLGLKFLEYLNTIPEYKIRTTKRKTPRGEFTDFFTANEDLAARLQNNFQDVFKEYKDAVIAARKGTETGPSTQDQGSKKVNFELKAPIKLSPIEALVWDKNKGKKVKQTVYPVVFPKEGYMEKEEWLRRNKIKNEFLKFHEFVYTGEPHKKWAALDEDGQDFVTDDFEMALSEFKEDHLRKRKSVELSTASNADIDVPTPEGLAYKPYQKAGIKRGISTKKYLIADEMGLGKTMQAIGIAQMVKPKNILIICPKSVMSKWEKEWKKWDTIGLSVEQAVTKETRGGDLPNAAVVIAGFKNFSLVPEAFKAKKWDMIIVDESDQILANSKTKAAKAIIGENKKVGNEWRTIQEPIEADRMLLLTGTPIPNEASQLFPTLKIIDPKGLGKSFLSFRKKYMKEGDTIRTRGGKIITKYHGAQNTDELQQKMREVGMTRRMKHDVQKELPSKNREIISLSPDGETKNLISEQIKIREILKTGKKEVAGEKARFTTGSTVRRKLGERKIPFIIKEAKKILSTKRKLVIFAWHVSVIDAVAEGLSEYNPVKYGKGLSQSEKDKNVDLFQEDPNVRVIVVSIRSGYAGIDLYAADTMLFGEISWTPGMNQQCEDRIHRIGQRSDTVYYKYLIYDNSLDGRILEINADKADTQAKVLDADEMESMLNVQGIEASEDDDDDEPTEETTPEPMKDWTYLSNIDRYLPPLTDDERGIIVDAAGVLADLDPDKARDRNLEGYSAPHSQFGAEVATSGISMPHAELWRAAFMLCPYYRRQLPQHIDRLRAILKRGKEESITPDEMQERKEGN